MKIEQWQVKNGIATPVNPTPLFNNGEYIGNEAAVADFNKFEQFTQQHTYATSAPPGIHSAEMFGEVVWQYNSGAEWINEPSINAGIRQRLFLPFKHPVEPNDKQPTQSLPVPLEYKISTSDGVTSYNPAHPEMNTIGRGITHPINPNAIKIVSDRIEELKSESEKLILPLYIKKHSHIWVCISELRNILKLLQS